MSGIDLLLSFAEHCLISQLKSRGSCLKRRVQLNRCPVLNLLCLFLPPGDWPSSMATAFLIIESGCNSPGTAPFIWTLQNLKYSINIRQCNISYIYVNIWISLGMLIIIQGFWLKKYDFGLVLGSQKIKRTEQVFLVSPLSLNKHSFSHC